jgi:hypothetical protein
MQAMRLTGLDGAQVTLDQPLVTQRTQPFELRLPHALTGGGKCLQQWFASEPAIQLDQLANFKMSRVSVRLADGRHFQRIQDLRVVVPQKPAKRGQIRDTMKSLRRRSAECNQPFCRAYLRGQQPGITEKFLGDLLRGCRLVGHVNSCIGNFGQNQKRFPKSGVMLRRLTCERQMERESDEDFFARENEFLLASRRRQPRRLAR